MTNAETKPAGDAATVTKLPAEGDIVARRKEIIRRRPRVGIWVGRVALAGFLFALWWYRDWIGQHVPNVANIVWNFENRALFLSTLKQYALAGAAAAVQFFIIGFLVLWAAGKPKGERSTFLRKLALLTFGLGLTTIVRGLQLGEMPDSAQMLIPVLGCLTGMTVGSASLRGKKGLIRLGAWTFAHALILTAFLFALGYLATDTEPLNIEAVKITASEKRQLMDRIKQAARDRSNGADTRQVQLSEDEVTTLFGWGMEAAGLDTRVDLRLEPETVTMQASPRVTLPFVGQRFVQVHLTANVDINDGRQHLQITELQLGRLRCPSIFCGSLSRAILAVLKMDSDVKTIVTSIEKLQVDEATVTLAGNRTVIREQVLPSIQSKLGMSPELIAATGAQLENLAAKAGSFPRGDARFLAIATEAFAFAQQDSADNNPVMENQAAILALGIVLGHPRVADLSGNRDAIEYWAAARQRIGNVTIRGRSDWTQHFCVSAALAVLANITTSDLVGRVKEEIDSGGGSGFSFSDLLADRAGTQFAEVATRDEASARKLQQRFAGGVTIDDLFPPAADLPEGIQEAEFKSKFGGVDGPKSREIRQEIERRLRGCYLLQP